MPDVTCGLIQLIREWFNKQEARVTHDPNIQVFILDYTLLIWDPYNRLTAFTRYIRINQPYGRTPRCTFDSQQFSLSKSIIFMTGVSKRVIRGRFGILVPSYRGYQSQQTSENWPKSVRKPSSMILMGQNLRPIVILFFTS